MFPAFYLSPIGTTAIVNARSLSDLGGRDRTRAVTKTVGIIALAWVLPTLDGLVNTALGLLDRHNLTADGGPAGPTRTPPRRPL
jgi:hypothetical protein